MGKRILAGFIILVLLPALGLAAPGQNGDFFPPLPGDARDITDMCDITVSSQQGEQGSLSDRDFLTVWGGGTARKHVEIVCAEKAYGLYICWKDAPEAWKLTQETEGVVSETSYEAGSFLHQFIPLKGADRLRLEPEGSSRDWFGVREIYVFSKGNIPSFVQQWQWPDSQCDLMLFTAHPDDEMLFFGGLLPTYAGEYQKDVVVSLLTPSSGLRTSELLNALWLAGVTQYPVLGPFQDKNSNSLEKAYRQFDKATVYSYVVGMLRKYRPTVVVTHDINGEYGHGMHSICANSAVSAFDLAANEKKYSASAKEFGVFQVQKLYLHLYPDNPLIMDWDQGLQSFRGLTGFEVARQGYQEHASQHQYEHFVVEPFLSDLSSYHFGLYKTRVGEDVYKNDFLENTVAALFP